MRVAASSVRFRFHSAVAFAGVAKKFFAASEPYRRSFASGEVQIKRGNIMRMLIASAALVTAAFLAGPAGAQTGTGQFCLKSATGQANCTYQTMAQCEQARPAGSSNLCVDKSQLSGTVGSGAPSPSASPSPPPAGGATPPKAPPQ
jgi:hypothetical protein